MIRLLARSPTDAKTDKGGSFYHCGNANDGDFFSGDGRFGLITNHDSQPESSGLALRYS